MKRIVECVPNFSEGRRKEVVDALAAELSAPDGVSLLDCEMDAAHNRCVITVAGYPDAVARGVVRAVGKAAELIDLREHKGEHPRMGATDVIPFVPISGIDMADCVTLSLQVAEQIAGTYQIPVYLYEQSARVPERQDLAFIRKGEFEKIREEIGSVPERKPDFGPASVHPSAGVTAVGARFPLIAYNVYLNTSDLRIAQAIAKAVRHSGGGLRYVKALGFEIKNRNQVQVSMNLTNFEGTPIFRAFDMVAREAERYGVSVSSSEIVGLVPQRALDDCADYYLKLENFSAHQVLENRLEEAAASGSDQDDFVHRVASPDPTPGGGSVAAHAGQLAAALGEMVAGLTAGNKKFAAVEPRMRELQEQLRETRTRLRALVDEDSAAYLAIVKARTLPKNSDEEKTQRMAAIQEATRLATETPLRTARLAAEVLGLLHEIARAGNPSARSDAATGGFLAYAALKGAQSNILVNLAGLADLEFATRCRQEVEGLVRSAEPLVREIEGRNQILSSR